jgi:Reverse transcriptase (RNA-dependent DNA polymerase)
MFVRAVRFRYSLIQSYASGRSQYVRVAQKRSTAFLCEFGVPWGSVLAPLLYTLYVVPVASVIASPYVNHMQYAEDTQLYIAFENTNTTVRLDSYFVAFEQ